MKKKQAKFCYFLIPTFVAFLIGVFLVIGAAGGWFDDPKVVIEPEYYSEPEIKDISIEEYDQMIKGRKSFVLLIDQTGCITAEKLRTYALDYAMESEMKIFRIMFSEVKNTNLDETIKYYPSVVIIDKGKVREYLKADLDADADAYNNYEDFVAWLQKFIVVENF